MRTDIDVLVIGAGLAGIAAGHHLKSRCPDRSFLILEGRERIGGTWDLFRYPGVRCDSDMYTLSYTFKPWTRDDDIIAGGSEILDYIGEAVEEQGLAEHIRTGHRMVSANWSRQKRRWTVEVRTSDSNQVSTFMCRFLIMASGFYNYQEAHRLDVPGQDRFKGDILHPQFWPDDVDYNNKRLVVIGSGATAITLVPELAERAAHVTMLQRSPSFMVARPSVDPLTKRLSKWMPRKALYQAVRWKSILMSNLIYKLSRTRPDRVRQRLLKWTEERLGPEGDVSLFNPRYNPWDQRICVDKDGVFYAALREGQASIVTDTIEEIDETGIKLTSGDRLDADIIVTATGLEMVAFGGASLQIDNTPIAPQDLVGYRSVMFGQVPNFAYLYGYAASAWTLKCELAMGYICRVLNHMQRRGFEVAVPEDPPETDETSRLLLDLQSGFVQRAAGRIPRQGQGKPWEAPQNYLIDRHRLLNEALEDGVMRFYAPQ